MRITLTQEVTSSPAVKAPQSPLTIAQGDVIRATVVSVQGESISLKTEDGRQFSARLQPGTVLMEHDTVELMAGGTEREQPVLRVVFVEPGQTSVTARETAKISTPVALTQQLKEAFALIGLKPTPKLISLAAEILKNYPTDIKTAAFFAANNIPATQESIRAFDAILNGKQFGAAFYEVAQDTLAALGSTAVEVDQKTPLVQARQGSIQPGPTDAFSGAPRAQVDTTPVVGSSVQAQEQQGANVPQQGSVPMDGMHIPVVTGQGEAAGKALGQILAQPQTEGAPVTGQNPVFAEAENVQVKPQSKETSPATGKPAAAFQGEPAAERGKIKEQPVLQQAGSDSTAKQAQQMVANASTKEAKPNQPKQPNALQPQGSITEDGNPFLPKQTGAIEKSAYTLDTAATTSQDESAEQAPGLASKDSAVFPHMSKAVQKQLMELFAKAGEDLNAQTLKKSVEETPQKLLELQKLIKNTDIHTQEALVSRFQELTAQAKLAEDISRFVFVQIPIHLKEYGSAELYIYKRNRREKGAERQSTSVVLGLSTQNLGRVEAMLRMENRDISLDIRIQNENALAAFRENSVELQQSFSELRFQLKEYKVSPLREKTTPLNAEERLVRMHAPSGAGVDVMI